MFNVTAECTYCDEEGDEDTTKFTALKHQVHTLRHDLAEKNALLATVQKKLNRNRPQQYNNGTMGNESTTGKVIGHLQHEIEHLKKEVAGAKTSIHIAKVARERADRQAAEHYASHQTLKLEIDSLKRMLELDRDKTNKSLQESESKAAELEKQLAIVSASREQAEFQYQLLSKELQNFKTRYMKDVESIKVDFQELRSDMVSTSKGLKKVVVEAGSRIETLTKELDRMKKDVEISNEKTKLYSNQVAKVEDEITNKMAWLKNIQIR
ncbi:928_t:CDS:2 [Funneliformis caledonium]|uniref:928_t:CDS:1 n=1 Tax=Funneliformis caledonium TaxID=1117310 RepID=A0A9N8YPP1_9GLOM|nr:928_t:CDS:2 [Funneliformis caledonium]